MKAVRADYVFDDVKEKTSFIINPYDLLALQSVLEKRDREKSQVACISMGGSNIKEALIKSIALGVDDVYWLNDSAFAGADTVATSYALSESIKKTGEYDLIVCGAKAVDGETGQVGIGISERLGIPCITDVEELIELDDVSVTVRCVHDDIEEIVKYGFPVAIVFKNFTTVTNNLSLLALKRAQRKQINVWNAESVNLDKEKCGICGSKTKVLGVVSDLNKKRGIIMEGDSAYRVRMLDDLLQKRSGFINEQK
ncbi:electron transfer flavoprotein subunit beta/FixA family protein [Clostridium felsineum]|uniref:electron transfer flavoprotein subunit beta/FixA family protein n=1 Tax=Clostridium felsineum TaxID=36839 RepID=UPI001591BD7E|nr:hypothetical protein [Clostridium felsineum]